MDRNKTVDRVEICETAAAYFGGGFHCGEAVAAAVLEGLGHVSTAAVSHATAFGGGLGRTFQEMCGALAGAAIVIGHLHGRKIPGQAWDLPAELGTEIREKFIERFGTTTCETLRRQFGEEQQMDQCRNLVKSLTYDLLVLLSEDSE